VLERENILRRFLEGLVLQCDAVGKTALLGKPEGTKIASDDWPESLRSVYDTGVSLAGALARELGLNPTIVPVILREEWTRIIG
jgi:hypothetical protein